MLLEMNLLWERDAPGVREDRPASLDLDASAMLADRGEERALSGSAMLLDRGEERSTWRVQAGPGEAGHSQRGAD